MSLIKWITSFWDKTEIPIKVDEAIKDEFLNLTEIQRYSREQAISLMVVINESLQISNNSTNPETKVSRLELARSKLDSLEHLAVQHPFIKLQRLNGVRKTIFELANEYSEAGYYAKTDLSCRDYQQDVWKNISFPIGDITKGWEFAATMQLRTPLRVLTRHHEKHIGLTDPPAIAQEQWEGGWLPILKSNVELGIPNVPEVVMTNPEMASDIGPIPRDGGKYLKFLIKVRAIVEAESSIENRRSGLREELRRLEWAEFRTKLGGDQNISNMFFPPFIQTIKGLPSDAIAAMWEAGLSTPIQLENSTDVTLKAFKGIGPAKLALIRAACFAALNKSSEFSDNVCR